MISHGNKVARLHRPADQRKALLRNLTTDLLRYGRITTTMARAKAMRKPVYVAAESYKFARLYPLNQRDLPESHAHTVALPLPESAHADVVAKSPACDYTPPQFITLLFTDLGILTPAAVSDELIRLYQ